MCEHNYRSSEHFPSFCFLFKTRGLQTDFCLPIPAEPTLLGHYSAETSRQSTVYILHVKGITESFKLIANRLS
jgi:hypothetical protein